MPLPTDEHTLKLSQDLLQSLDNLFGVHPGFRAAHAKGLLLSGRFTPTTEARTLTRAAHAQRNSTPVTVRFSDSAGIPDVADNDGNLASPRGFAVRFHLAEHVHTDIVAHSVNAFPAHTPEELLEFFRAVKSSGPDSPKPTPIEAFLGSHPSALKFVTAPKPIPTSFARESFYAVNAFKFINAAGDSRFGRYRIVPALGNDYLDDAGAAQRGPNFLFDELHQRVTREPIQLNIVVQLAESGDVVDDATVDWPADRPQQNFGTITLTEVVANSDSEQRHIIFDPIPRTDGIESSGDPLLEVRAAVYLMSGRRRRQASGGGASA